MCQIDKYIQKINIILDGDKCYGKSTSKEYWGRSSNSELMLKEDLTKITMYE